MDPNEFDELLSQMIAELVPLVTPAAASAESANGHLNEHAAARILGKVMARIAAAEGGMAEISEVALNLRASRAAAQRENTAAPRKRMPAKPAPDCDVAPLPGISSRSSRKSARLDFEQLEPRNPLSTLSAFGTDSFSAYHPASDLLHAAPRFVACEPASPCTGGAIAVLW